MMVSTSSLPLFETKIPSPYYSFEKSIVIERKCNMSRIEPKKDLMIIVHTKKEKRKIAN
jgi:hypothetical protein